MIIPNIWKNKKCSKPPIIYQFGDLENLCHATIGAM
jgi:hypothetical protein